MSSTSRLDYAARTIAVLSYGYATHALGNSSTIECETHCCTVHSHMTCIADNYTVEQRVELLGSYSVGFGLVVRRGAARRGTTRRGAGRPVLRLAPVLRIV